MEWAVRLGGGKGVMCWGDMCTKGTRSRSLVEKEGEAETLGTKEK
jgi:hypothetical protein